MASVSPYTPHVAKKEQFWRTNFERSVRFAFFIAMTCPLLVILLMRMVAPYVGLYALAAIWLFVGGYAFATQVHKTRYLERYRFRVCKSCGYPLNAGHAHGNCPECGTPFRLGETRKFWWNRHKYMLLAPFWPALKRAQPVVSDDQSTSPSLRGRGQGGG